MEIKTENIIKLSGLQHGCLTEQELRKIIKYNFENGNKYILETEHGLVDSHYLAILFRFGYVMEIYNSNMLRFKQEHSETDDVKTI